jgi:hypothetical protein
MAAVEIQDGERKMKEKEQEEQEKRKCIAFSSRWNSGNTKTERVLIKLSCYGLIKLQKLARSKAVKRFSTYSKEGLIIELEKVCDESDFPIP